MTGPRGAGKTTFCELLYYHLTVELPVVPNGAWSLALFSRRAQGTEGYDLEIRSDTGTPRGAADAGSQIIPLARQSKAAPQWAGGILGPWVFSQDAFDRATSSFERAFNGLTRGGLFVLDEVGPLELKLGRGFTPILDQALALPRLVTVVRPALVDSLRKEPASLGDPANGTERSGGGALLEIEPGILDDKHERRRLLRIAEEALT